MLMLIPCSGFAEQCENLEKNELWTSNVDSLVNELESNTLDAAQESARLLYQICPRSPVLNYYLGILMHETGDETKSTMYFQKASEYISEFVVNPEMSRKIWYARYESENPDSTASSIGLLKQQNSQLKQQNENLRRDVAASTAESESYKSMQTSFSGLEQDALKKRYLTITWTGAGIGILGAVSFAAGSALAFSSDKKYEVANDNDDILQRKYEIKKSYTAGWALFGTGLGLIVAGSVMAGIGGYYYTKLNEQTTLSLQFMPNSASLTMNF